MKQNTPPRNNRPVQSTLSARLMETRGLAEELVAPLSPEDMTVQPMEDASPTKWHLAHTTWFFETFVLSRRLPGYERFDDTFNYCFNSYYESQGARQPRPRRGVLTRPSIERVMAYRAYVDSELSRLCESGFDPDSELARLIEVGINHEQQHQELLLTDILALFAANPLRPAYRTPRPRPIEPFADATTWIRYPGGIRQIGHSGEGFAWDNEAPRHDALVHPFALADRLVTNAEWLEFMSNGGYARASLWLADGWTTVNREGWQAPLYWEMRDGQWLVMSLEGLLPINPSAPVAHISYYEADAFARWAGKRLPTEFEWEVAANKLDVGSSLGSRALRPLPAGQATGKPRQMFGDVWGWTQSAYLPYPGYRPPAGALGEYNGKFMVSQQVLRTLISAYDDSAGVTAAFNLNLLARINRELVGNFDVRAFDHMVLYNQVHGRIEMHIVSLVDQEVVIRGRLFQFAIGETIHTENSYKYSVSQFRDMARAAGWQPRRVWTDRNALFGVHELVSA